MKRSKSHQRDWQVLESFFFFLFFFWGSQERSMRVTFKQRAERWDKFTTRVHVTHMHVTYMHGRCQEGEVKKLTFLIRETWKMTQEETRWTQGTQRCRWGLRMSWQGQAIREQLKNLDFESSVRSFNEESHITPFCLKEAFWASVTRWSERLPLSLPFILQPVKHSQAHRGACVHYTETLENFPHKCTAKGGEREHTEAAEPQEQWGWCPQCPDLRLREADSSRGGGAQDSSPHTTSQPPPESQSPWILEHWTWLLLPTPRFPTTAVEPATQGILDRRCTRQLCQQHQQKKGIPGPAGTRSDDEGRGAERQGTKDGLSNINRSSWGKRNPKCVLWRHLLKNKGKASTL